MPSRPILPLWIVLVVGLMALSGVLAWLRTRSASGRVASKIYGSIVAQARSPALYGALGVADTPMGRLEMVILHLVLVLDRLRPFGRAAERIGQALIEAFVDDIDDAVREVGIADAGVPRRVRRATAALGERDGAYRAALAAPAPDALVAALQAYAYEGRPAAEAERLAGYVRALRAGLAASGGGDLLAGRLVWPAEALACAAGAGPAKGDRT